MSKDNKETETKQCTIPSVSGSIIVYDGTIINQKKLYSNSKWFDCEYYNINLFDDYFTIKKCGLEVSKKARKLSKSKQLTLICDIPLGEFEFDEDSTEDELVVYYR